MHCSCTVHRSHNTIHAFKNYFTTMFSVFNFDNNKFNPNRPKEKEGKNRRRIPLVIGRLVRWNQQRKIPN